MTTGSKKGNNNRVSLHQKILTDMENNILSDKWPPGYKIPFEHELMEKYGCSRMTVSKVMTQLVNMKLIERRRRVGSFVTKPHSSSAVLEINDVSSEVEELGKTYDFEITSRRSKKASLAEQKLLGVEKGDPVLKLLVCHYANKRPFCLEERLISLLAVPSAGAEQFEELSPGSWLRKMIPWIFAEHRIRAGGVSDAAADQLDMPPGSPVLVVERRTWSAEQAVTFVRFTYPADGHEIMARFSPSGS